MNCMFKWLNKKMPPPKGPVVPAWFDIAMDEIGVKEVPGSGNNPRIVEYHQATSLKATSDLVPWCASFICWTLNAGGAKSSGSAAAQSYLKWGKPVTLDQARHGDVVCLTRPGKSWSGHVGYYYAHDKDAISLLGGNQSNEVNITAYPMSRLMGIRRANETI